MSETRVSKNCALVIDCLDLIRDRTIEADSLVNKDKINEHMNQIGRLVESLGPLVSAMWTNFEGGGAIAAHLQDASHGDDDDDDDGSEEG